MHPHDSHDVPDPTDPSDPFADLPIYDPESGETNGSADAEEEVEDELLEDQLRTVLITGASGNLGRKLRAAWEDVYDLVLLDVAAGPDDPDVIEADLTEWDDAWADLFQGV